LNVFLSRIGLIEANIVDLHGGVVRGRVIPSWVPGTSGIPEFVGSLSTAVSPRLTTNTIREVTISATSSNIHDKEELTVERSSVGFVSPGVELFITETTSFPHGFLREINIKNNI